MADDRMKNDDLRHNMGSTGEGQDYDQGMGRKTPGRSQQGGQQSGQQGGQHTGGQQGGQQKNPRNLEDDDEFGGGSPGQGSGMGRGSQNR